MQSTTDPNIKKLIGLAEDFDRAYADKQWSKAKLIYDKACTVIGFLDPPEEVWRQLFGHYSEETDEAIDDGLFMDTKVRKVMRECISKNHLGFECMVYRIPGEIGYHGAKPEAGARPMRAEQNPAYCTQ